MNAFINRTEAAKKAVSFLASFVLAFSLFATPAYAATAEEPAVQPANEELLEGTVESAQPSNEAETTPVASEQPSAPVQEQPVLIEESASEDADNSLEAVAEEPTEGTQAPVEGSNEGTTEEAPFALDVNASYHSDGVVSFALTLTNPTDTTFKNISLVSDITVEGISTSLDLPQGITLDPGETKVIPATMHIDPNIAYGSEPFVVYLFTAACGNLEADASGNVAITASKEDVKIDVNIQASLYDESGTYRPDIDFALPGHKVVFTFEVTNKGLSTLTDVHANPLGALVPTDDWATNRTLQPGQSTVFTATYAVTAADDPEGPEYGALTGMADIFAGGVGDTYSDSPYKVGKPEYGYTINYFAGDQPLGTYVAQSIYGPYANIDEDVANKYLPEGYLPAEGFSNLVLSEDASKNVFEVHYQVKQTDLPYLVRFYKGSIATKNLLGVEEGIGDAGETYLFDTDFLNKYLPEEGYKTIQDQRYLTVSLDPTENVLMVVYEPETVAYTVSFYQETPQGKELVANYAEDAHYGDVVNFSTDFLNSYLPHEGYKPLTQALDLAIKANAADNHLEVVFERADVEFTVSWYRDSALYERNRITTQTFTAKYGDTVRIDASLMNQFRPHEGYKPFAESDYRDLYISADPQNNNIDLVYSKDTFAYTVNYYTDVVSPDTFIDSVTGSATYASMVYNIDMNRFLPEGYQPIEERGSVYISADPARNVLNVVYAKRANIPYTVNYYRDSVSAENLLGSDSFDNGTLDANIPYEQGKYLPEGYSASTVLDGQRTITANASDNVLNVVYTDRAEYAYYVNYYVDSVDPSNFLGTNQGKATYGSPISYVAGSFAPEGYEADQVNVEGATLVSADESRNILNVVYTTKTQFTYTVNYYADEVGGTLLNSITGYGTLGEEIPYSMDAFMPDGYEFGQVSGAIHISANAQDSVVNVVYNKARYHYQVNYYKDTIAAENLLGMEEGFAPYLSATPYTEGAYVPEGYVAPGALSGAATISYDQAANVLNIVYQPGRFAYTVNYYRGNVSPDNLISTTTEEGRLYGSTVVLVPSELNNQLPEGYLPLDQAREVQITNDPARNVVDVVFQPDFDIFYAAGIDPLNVTYTGSTFYVEPRGVVPGDVITYSYQGLTQTRVVGVDSNYRAEFVDVTDGDLPVSVTLTRAGITSNAVQTIVNIAPKPADGGTVPGAPDQSGTTNPQQPGNEDVEDIIYSVLPWINPALQAPAAGYETSGDLAADSETAGQPSEDEMTIEDDENPLAASPSSPFSFDLTGSKSALDPIGYLFLILSALFAVGAVALFLIRRRMIERSYELKGSTLAVEQFKVKRMLFYLVGTGSLAVVFYALWVLLKI